MDRPSAGFALVPRRVAWRIFTPAPVSLRGTSPHPNEVPHEPREAPFATIVAHPGRCATANSGEGCDHDKLWPSGHMLPRRQPGRTDQARWRSPNGPNPVASAPHPATSLRWSAGRWIVRIPDPEQPPQPPGSALPIGRRPNTNAMIGREAQVHALACGKLTRRLPTICAEDQITPRKHPGMCPGLTILMINRPILTQKYMDTLSLYFIYIYQCRTINPR
jgi:hypothetical protein